MRKIYAILGVVMLFAGSLCASAQSDGYNRLRNIATGHYAYLAGSHHFSPDVDEQQALSLPGTVGYMQFATSEEGNRVTSLRLQGVDVVNDLLPMLPMMIRQYFTEDVYLELRDSAAVMVNANMSGAMGSMLVGYINRFSYQDFLDWVDQTDTNLYYAEAGRGYCLYIKTPKFPLNAGDLNSYFISKVNNYLTIYRGSLQRMASEYLADRPDLLPMVYSLVSHLRFEDYLYLTEQTAEGYEGNFGFANVADLPGTAHEWEFVPVDDNMYLGLAGQVQDASGKWYTSLAAGFPITLGEGMEAYTVTDDVNMDRSLIQWKKLDTDFIPAFTPVIVALNGSDAASNKVTLSPDFSIGTNPGRLILATDENGFLLGKNLEYPDPHYYQLGVTDGKVCLKVIEEPRLNASEAYYYLDDYRKQVDTTGYLLLVDDADGIAVPTASAMGSTDFYDLQGRRVNAPSKGIYIRNGRKVLVR